jgi:uncharacterized protein YecT (DUF1311 family)
MKLLIVFMTLTFAGNLSSGQPQSPLQERAQHQKAALAALTREQAKGGRDCPGAATTYDVNICLSNVADETEKNFNDFYKHLFVLLEGEDNGPQEKLDDAEAQWLEYRKQSCAAIHELYKGGTIRPSAEMRCAISLTRSRMRDLAELYDIPLHN